MILKEIFLLADKNITYNDCMLNQQVIDEMFEWKKNILLKSYSDLEKDYLKKFAWMSLHIEELDDLSLDSIN